MLQYSGYDLKIWWLIIGVSVFEIIFVKWRRWEKTTSITPEQKLGGLLSLIRIRSAELGSIYYSLRGYQKQATNGHSWIPLFMGEYKYLNRDLYDESSETKKQKYLTKAHSLFKKRFPYEPGFFDTLEESVLLDTTFAIHYWSSGFDLTINLLDSIPFDSKLSSYIRALIREYRLLHFLSFGGNYHILFKGWFISNLIRERYKKLRSIWWEIICYHQAVIIIAKSSSTIESNEGLDIAYTENRAVADMERNLERAISQENSKSFGWDWDWKNEASFFKILKSNPIWTQFRGYDPYFEQEYKEQEGNEVI